MWPSGPIMLPTYLAYLTTCISRKSSQLSDRQFNRDSSLSLPYCTQRHFRWFKLSQAIRSTATQVPKRSLSPGEMEQPQRGPGARNPGQQGSVECSRLGAKDRVEGHRKQETTRWTALSHAPSHEELSSGHSCEFDACGAVVLDSP